MKWSGDRYDCPICKFANQQYSALKQSNWKDADARKKNKEFGRKFQAIIPVYVVNDPNYEGNNGKIRVVIFSDKKFYDEFVKKIEKQLLKANCFNGVNAVDCCLHVSLNEEIINEGQPNQWTLKTRVIDQIAFSTPYNLPAITKEAIDAFPFDDSYYVGSTSDDLKAFYTKYIKVSNDDIIEEDEDVQVYDFPKNTSSNVKTNDVNITPVENKNINNKNLIDAKTIDNDIIDLTEDPDEIGLSVNTDNSSNKSTELNDIDDILAGIDI